MNDDLDNDTLKDSIDRLVGNLQRPCETLLLAIRIILKVLRTYEL